MAARKRKKARQKTVNSTPERHSERNQIVNRGLTGVMLLFAAILIILEFVDILGYTYQWWREVGDAF